MRNSSNTLFTLQTDSSTSSHYSAENYNTFLQLSKPLKKIVKILFHAFLSTNSFYEKLIFSDDGEF